MNYSTDYFKPEDHQLYPRLTLDYGEYARFLDMCQYLDAKLGRNWFSIIFYDNNLSLKDVILDIQIISIVTPTEVIIIEKFYYKIYLKYLEEKILILTHRVSHT